MGRGCGPRGGRASRPVEYSRGGRPSALRSLLMGVRGSPGRAATCARPHEVQWPEVFLLPAHDSVRLPPSARARAGPLVWSDPRTPKAAHRSLTVIGKIMPITLRAWTTTFLRTAGSWRGLPVQPCPVHPHVAVRRTPACSPSAVTTRRRRAGRAACWRSPERPRPPRRGASTWRPSSRRTRSTPCETARSSRPPDIHRASDPDSAPGIRRAPDIPGTATAEGSGPRPEGEPP